MGTEAPTIITLPVHCAPMKAPCPECGKHGRRKRKLPPRRVRTVAYKTIAYLDITCGEYQARCDCCTTFRNTPVGVLPRALCHASITPKRARIPAMFTLREAPS